MSEENVEIVRNASDSFKAFMRDELSSEAYVERFDPEIELHWRDRQEYPDFPQISAAQRTSSHSVSNTAKGGLTLCRRCSK
jgi:hypothetical protein